MSQQPPPSGGSPSRTGEQDPHGQFNSPAQRRAQDPYFRDPDTGRFLTDDEAAYVERLARQYPQQVQQAYDQNVSFAAVGLPVPPTLGDAGTQVGNQKQPQQKQPQQQQPQQQQPQQPPQSQGQIPPQETTFQQQQPGSPPPEQGGRVHSPGQPPQGPTNQPAQQGVQQQPRPETGGGAYGQSQAPPGQSPGATTGPPERATGQPQEDRSSEGVSIPIQEGGDSQQTDVPSQTTGRQSQRPASRRQRRQRQWYWWYSW